MAMGYGRGVTLLTLYREDKYIVIRLCDQHRDSQPVCDCGVGAAGRHFVAPSTFSARAARGDRVVAC